MAVTSDVRAAVRAAGRAAGIRSDERPDLGSHAPVDHAGAEARFEWVIVDTPPVGLLPDASLLADFVDGVLLVVRAGKAPFRLVKRTVEAITTNGFSASS